MPYITFTTTKILTLQQELDLKKKAGKLVSILGKSESHLMIHIEDNQLMYFRGEEEHCMMIQFNGYRHVDYDKKKAFVEELIKESAKVTKVPIDNIYVTISEFDNWGMFQEYV